MSRSRAALAALVTTALLPSCSSDETANEEGPSEVTFPPDFM